MKREAQAVPQPLLPVQPISEDVLREKYCKEGERGIEDIFLRVARALAGVEAEPLRATWEARFLSNLQAGPLAPAES